MNITINGKSQELNASQNLTTIVTAYCQQSRHVITELNGSIIPSEKWAQTMLKEGDALELVTFVGGG